MKVGIALHKINFGQYKDIFWVVNDVYTTDTFPLALVTIKNDGKIEIRFYSIEGREIDRKQIDGKYSVVAAGIFPEMNVIAPNIEPVILFGSMNLWVKQEKDKVFITFISPIASEIEELTKEGKEKEREWIEVDFGDELDLFIELWKKSYFMNRKNTNLAYHITPFISELILRVKEKENLRILRDRYVYANAKDVSYIIGRNWVNKWVYYFNIESATPVFSGKDVVIVRKGTEGYVFAWEYNAPDKVILPLKLIPIKLYKGNEVLERKEFLSDGADIELVVDYKVDNEIFLGRLFLSGVSLVYNPIDYIAYSAMYDIALNNFLKNTPQRIKSNILKYINTDYERKPKDDNKLFASYIEEAKQILWSGVKWGEDSVIYTLSSWDGLTGLLFDYLKPLIFETVDNDIWIGKIEGRGKIKIPIVAINLR